jgi:hypothetical protein
VAYEAGPCGFSLYDALDSDGIRCIVMLFYSLRTPGGTRDTWSRRYVAALRTMTYPYAARRIAMEALLTDVEQCGVQITALNRKIMALAREVTQDLGRPMVRATSSL